MAGRPAGAILPSTACQKLARVARDGQFGLDRTPTWGLGDLGGTASLISLSGTRDGLVC
jgi:hypothetical protein